MSIESKSTELKTYERLGIKQFKKYMPLSGDLVRPKLQAQKMLPILTRNPESIHQAINDTKILAMGHGSVFILGTIYAFSQIGENPYVALATEAINVFANLYPVMLQRYNWLRLSNLRDKIEAQNINIKE